MNNFTDDGVKLIKEFEGCALIAYQDPGGIWTIGYGCTHGVTQGMTLADENAASQRLQTCCLPQTLSEVKTLITWPIGDNQFSALVAFTFNLGSGTLTKSTLRNCVNTGHLDDAANEFGKWIHENGIVIPGLVRRRAAERALFLAPDVSPVQTVSIPQTSKENT